MAEVMNAKNEIKEIPVSELLVEVMKAKNAGYRLSQACAAYIEDQFELSYSFADDATYDYLSIRIVVDKDTEVPSITEIMPQAVFYENEMRELFGVKIQMIALDYQDKLYRIDKSAPFGPKGDEDVKEGE